MKNIYGKYIEEFKWQRDAAGGFKKNLLVLAPTGAGKTIIAYSLMNKKWNDYEKIIFTAPIKALSNERYKELNQLYPGKVGILTGDIKKYDPINHKIICCTQEILLNKNFKNSLIIIDEIHYFFNNNDRAGAYLEYLYGALESNDHLMLSATISDDGIDTIRRVANFEFDTVIEKERPIELEFIQKDMSIDEVASFNSALIFAFSYRGVLKIANIIRNINRRYVHEDKIKKYFLSFNVNNGHLYELIKSGVGIYHGGMLIKEKLMIEELYRNKVINVLIGTNGLSLGVNLPAELVVFTQLEMYYQGLVSSAEFNQMAGRGGRLGLYPKGYVGICDFGIESYNSTLSGNYQILQKMPITESLTSFNFNIERLLQNSVCKNDVILLPDIELIKEVAFFKAVFPDTGDEELKAKVKNIYLAFNSIAETRNIKPALLLDYCQKYYFNEFDFEENMEYIISLEEGHDDLLKDVFGINLDSFPRSDGRAIRDLMQIRKYIKKKVYNRQAVAKIEEFVLSVDKNYLEI